MKKTIICNIPMRNDVEPKKYSCDDNSLPISDREVRYPINAMLEKTLRQDDELVVLLLVKKDPFGNYESNIEKYISELDRANENIGADIEYKIIDTDFVQTKAVHEELMGEIIDSIKDENNIIADITYGPKDVPIIVFYALNFAEKFLNCEVERIVYGQADFKDGKPINTKICDMTPLFSLGSLTNSVQNVTADKARQMLNTLLSL